MKTTKPILKIFPYGNPISKNANTSLWLVGEQSINNSKFANDFIIISAKSAYESDILDKNIIYISAKNNLHKPTENNKTIAAISKNSSISRKDYREQVLKKIKDLKPILIEVEADYKLAGAIAKKFRNIPVILISHSAIAKKPFIKRLFQYYHMKNITEIIFVSNYYQKHFFKHFFFSKKPNVVIHNSYSHVPLKEITFNNKANQIIFAGRSTTEKGYKEFIYGLLPILESYKDWNALAVLSVENKKSELLLNTFLNQITIQNAIKNNRLKISINLTNKELFDKFEQSKIAVFPTHSSFIEGLPLVGIEAHLAKCTVVASNNPGFKELSGNNIYYLDNISADNVAKKIEFLIKNPKFMEELAISGYNNIVNNYNIKDIIQKYDYTRSKYLQ